MRHNPSAMLAQANIMARMPRRLSPLARYLTWVAWLLLACLTAGVFIAAMPLRYAEEISACAGRQCAPLAAYLVALDAFTALVWLVLAALILWRRPGDRVGIFSSLTLLSFGVARFPDTPLALGATYPKWWLLIEALRFLGSACLSIFVFVFPDGRFTPRFTRVIAATWIAIQIPEFFFPSTVASANGWPPLLRFAGFLAFTLIVVVAQTWRYQRISTPVQRQQTRWAVLGLMLALACYLALEFGYPLALAIDPTLGRLPPAITTTLISFTFLLMPLSLAIAILRYNLYDVDVLINRALVYGSLTAALSALYFASVLLLQAAVSALTRSQQSAPLVIIASTLLLAALFQPLRRALQRGIDRRFYRRKYDMNATVKAFADSLRDDVDLVVIHTRLIDVVAETMQPAHVSLWLRPLPRHPKA